MRVLRRRARSWAARELLDAPVHWPRPSVLERLAAALKGVGPKTRRSGRRSRASATVGDLLFHIPAPPPRPADRGRWRPRARRDRRPSGRGPGHPAAPLPQPRPAMVSVKVGDETRPRPRHLVQPALGGLETDPRHAAPAHRQTPDKRLRGPRMGDGGALDAGDAVGAGGPGPGPSRQPSTSAPSRFAALDASRRSARRRTCSRRCRRSCGRAGGWPGSATRLSAVHFPESIEEVEEARERLGFEELFLHQALLATPQAHAPHRAPGAALRQARRARRRAGSSRCRSSRPAISSRPSTRSTPTSTPASRCSGC